MKGVLRLMALIFGVVLLLVISQCAGHLGIDSPRRPTEDELWEFHASVSPWRLPDGGEIDVTQIEFLIYAEDEERSRETGEPVVGELAFSMFAQRGAAASNGVAQGEIVFRRPSRNFFIEVNETSLPDSIGVEPKELQYFDWGTLSFGFTLVEVPEKQG